MVIAWPGLDQVERLAALARLQAVAVRIDLRELAGGIDVDEDQVARLLRRDAERHLAAARKLDVGQDREIESGCVLRPDRDPPDVDRRRGGGAVAAGAATSPDAPSMIFTAREVVLALRCGKAPTMTRRMPRTHPMRARHMCFTVRAP